MKFQVFQDTQEPCAFNTRQSRTRFPISNTTARDCGKFGPGIHVEFIETTEFEPPPGTKFRLILLKVGGQTSG